MEQHRRGFLFFSSLVYLTLFIGLFLALKQGPLEDLAKNRTHIVVEQSDLRRKLTSNKRALNNNARGFYSDRYDRFPVVVICRAPGIREGANSSAVSPLPKDIPPTFPIPRFTLDPASFISVVSVSQSMHDVRPMDLHKVLEPLVGDCFISGFCYAFNVTRHFVEMEADLKEGVPLLVSLGFREEISDRNLAPTYYISVSDQGEERFFGMVMNLGNGLRSNDWHGLRYGSIFFGETTMTYHKNIRDCNTTNAKISPCMSEYLDGIGCSRGFPFSCENGTTFGLRCSARFQLQTLGYQAMRTLTGGCQMPCQRFSHSMSTVFDDERWKAFPPRVSHPALADANSLAFVNIPLLADSIRTEEETVVYGMLDCLGDMGGICGLLLGASAWGVFQTLVTLVNWAKNKAKNKLSRRA